VHHIEVTHDTWFSSVAGDPAGFGAVAMLQDIPFHCSTRGLTKVEPGPLTPTATQNEGPAHDTP
jgi:hypothetical protein